MRKSFTFNGVKKPWLYLLEGRRKSPFAPINNNLLRVPGMPGAYIQSTGTDVLYITQPIGFVVNDDKDALAKIDELAEWLITDEPVELQFDDEPGRTYYAKINGGIDEFDKFINQRRGTLVFLCADPYSYGPEKHAEFQDSGIVENEGTAEADPIFELEVLQPTTFAMVSNGDEYMMVGRPIDVTNQTPFKKYERVFYSDASSLVGWTTHNTVDGGVVDGQMESNGTRFQAASYGTGSSWHGPAIKTSLPEVLTDFRLEAFVGFFNKNVAAYVGRIEIYLLDVNGNTVGKLAIKDTQSGQALTMGEARAGDISNNHFLINEYGDRPGNWNNFNGIVRLQREDNQWEAYISMVDTSTGRHHTRRHVRWIDTENKFTRNVAQVAIHIGQYANHLTTAGGVYSISVFKINQEPEGVPYIADSGDKITFDHVTGDCFINGEPVPFDFGADFFKLKKGENTIVVLPENTFQAITKFRERYR